MRAGGCKSKADSFQGRDAVLNSVARTVGWWLLSQGVRSPSALIVLTPTPRERYLSAWVQFLILEASSGAGYVRERTSALVVNGPLESKSHEDRRILRRA